MPFPYQSAGAPVRVRKPLRERDKDKDRDKERGRDKDTRSITSSSSKRHTETSRSSNRSPLPSSSRPASLYSQSNTSLDQLPALPRSETASPSSTTSLPLRTSTSPSTSSIPLSSSIHPYTPAALQPYLETDDDDDDECDNAATPQASSSNQVKRYFDQDLGKSPSRTLSILSTTSPPTSVPNSSSSRPLSTTSPPNSAPKSSSRPVSTTSPPNSAPKSSSRPVSTALPPTSAPTLPASKTVSPQQRPALSPTLTRISTRSSDPSPSLQHPRPHHVPVGSPAFSPPVPFFGSPPPEHYYPPFPPAPQYYTLAQAPGHPMEHQPVPPPNYYQTPYGSSPQMHTAFHPLRSPPVRESSITSSRMSISGETVPPAGHTSIFSAEQAPRPEPLAQISPRGEDDAVLQRIQSAIPDLHHLLNRYQETSNQLGQREVALRRTEAEKAEVLKQKETHIESLTRDVLEKSRRSQEESSKHEDEKNKMRLELGNHLEQKKELEDHLHAEKTGREQSEKMVQDLRVELALLESKFEEEKAALLGEYEDERMKFRQQHESRVKDFQAREKEYVDRLERQMRDAEAVLSAKITELTQQHGSEKESQERAWARQRAEWEESRRNQQREASDAKDAHVRSLSEQRERHLQEREAWARERDSLKKDLDNERASAGRGSEELIVLHRKEKDDMQRSWDLVEAHLNQEQLDTEARMRNEIDRLEAGWEADKAYYSKTTTDLRATANRLNMENSKLQRVAEAFEQVTDLRGREDAYYLESFDFLSKQIFDLAQDFCSTCPGRISSDLTRAMPPDFPSCLTDTPASSPLRVAYVQSLVSEIINRRVFQHFLFTFDDLDNVFNEWADYLGSKSTKREAVWRQRTLHAAFSCPSSKPRINKFASSIIDDILYVIKPFADKSKREQILGAIKKIVKTAAETWRYARIELSRIRALPAVATSTEPGGEVLLTMFPCIKRDPLPDDIRSDVRDDAGCVYTDGQVLTRTSPTVLARRAELGERLTIASHTHTTQDANSDEPSRFENSSERGSQQTVYPARTTSPLMPRSQASRADNNEGSAPSSFSAQAGPSQQDVAGMGWLAEEARRNDYRGSRTGMSRRQDDDDLFEPVAGKQATHDHSATESPVQSPANSGVETPQLSQRTTATTSSTTDEEEDTESTPKAKGVPDWREAGGTVPGAW